MKRIRINEKFRPLFEDFTRRYVIITGGRGSAKSFSVATWACINTTVQEYRQRTLYSRYTLTSAAMSIIPEFQEKIELLNISRLFKVTASQVINTQTGSDIIFSGIKTSSGNQTAKLKSIQGINCFIIDEAEEFTEEKYFDAIDLSIRQQGMPNRVIMILNPTTIDHWIWTRFFENSHRYITFQGVQIPISTHPDVIHIHTTYLDNIENLPPEYLSQLDNLRTVNPAKYARLVIGAWMERAEGVIFENWQEGAFDDSLPYCYGLDYGYFPDPLALVKVAYDSNARKVYLKQVTYANNLTVDQTKDLIRREVPNSALIIADTSEPRLTNEIGMMGWNIQAASKGPDSVINGIKKLLDYQIIVDPESYDLKRELKLYAWNDKKASIPVDAHNHAIDAARYGAMRLMEGSDILAAR